MSIRELARLRLNAVTPVYHYLIPRNAEVVMKAFLGQMTIFLVSSLIMIDFKSDTSLVCCTPTNFQCEDKDALFGEFYCQNVANGCDGGQFYKRQEEDPSVNAFVTFKDIIKSSQSLLETCVQVPPRKLGVVSRTQGLH